MKLQLKRSLKTTDDNGVLRAQAPSVAQMDYGELAVNYSSGDPTIFLKDSNNVIQSLQLKSVPSLDPGQTLDDRYLPFGGGTLTGDLTATNFIGGVASVAATPPASAVSGQLYWDTGDNRLYINNGSAWVDESPDGYTLGEDFYSKTQADTKFLDKTAGGGAQTIAVDLSIGTGVSLNTDGTSSFAGSMTITGDIVPTADNVYSLGAADKMWRDVYIGPGSLYMNGIKVLESSAPQMVFSADENQNIVIQTSGDGDIELDPIGANGVVQVKSALQILNGMKITNSQGNAVEFGNDIAVDGITTTTDGVDLVLTGAGTGKVKIVDIAEATSFVKTGGTAAEFLKADGSVDSTSYLVAADLTVETNARTQAITDAINGEVTARNSAITTAVDAEALARTNAINNIDIYLEKAGGTMEGALVLNADPVAPLGACTKQYADDLLADIDTSGIGTNQSDISNLQTTKAALNGANFIGQVSVGGSDKIKFQTDGIAFIGNAATGIKLENTGAITGNKATTAKWSVTSDGVAVFDSITVSADPNTSLGVATKQYVDNATPDLSTVLPLTGGEVSGVISCAVAPSADEHLANKLYVDNRITDIIDAAPAALDTLSELAQALDNDSSFATTITDAIADKATTQDITDAINAIPATDLSGYYTKTETGTQITNAINAIPATDLSGHLELAGGIMTGALTLAGAPTQPLHSTSKQYVDDLIAGVTLDLAALPSI